MFRPPLLNTGACQKPKISISLPSGCRSLPVPLRTRGTSRHAHLILAFFRIGGINGSGRHIAQEDREASDKAEAEEQMFLHEVTYQETMRLLRRAIDRLPRRSRQIILLELDGKSNAETANLMGVSVNTVKTLKKSAYKSLRESIGSLPDFSSYCFFLRA